jgi:hypothetical protein
VDVQITPEPTAEEREAIVKVLELERDPEHSAWQKAALALEEDDAYATAPVRQSRGTTRA